jgi:UDP-GlcNAc:undecaprenyl-phosphate GlcNAc-1-phosphate transferase
VNTGIVLAFGMAAVLALVLTPLVRAVARSRGMVAEPKGDRWHKQPTALLGGVSIAVSFLVPAAFLLPLSSPRWGIVFGALAMAAVGLADDLRGMSPLVKLAGQAVAAGIAVAFGVRLDVIPIPWVAVPLTVFWILLIANAVNLLDNMDGLAAGITGIASMILLAFSLAAGNIAGAVVSAGCLGATIGFLRYNFYPASIFMGDSGSLLLGFVLASDSIIGTWPTQTSTVFALVVPVLILAVPLFDTTFVTFGRKMAGRPVSVGGRDHTSHRLVFLGLTEKQAVLTLYSICLLFGILANVGQFLNIQISVILALLVVIALIYFGIFLGGVEVPGLGTAREAGSRGTGRAIIVRLLEMGIDAVLISVAYLAAYLLRFEGAIAPHAYLLKESMPLLITTHFATFQYFGLYKSIWRYVGLRDVINIVKAVSVGTMATIVVLLFLQRFEGYSRAVFVLHWGILILLASTARGLVRVYRESFQGFKRGGKRLLIVGAGDGGEMLLREIRNNPRRGYDPVAFIDDDAAKKGRRIHGIAVVGTRGDLDQAIREYGIEEVLIAIPSANDIQLKGVYEICRSAEVPCRRISSIL